MVLHDLRARRASLVSQLEMLDERLAALSPAPPGTLRDWQRGTAAERALLFLGRHGALAWTPAQLMEATRCGEDALRRALTRLVRSGDVLRERHGCYEAARR